MHLSARSLCLGLALLPLVGCGGGGGTPATVPPIGLVATWQVQTPALGFGVVPVGSFVDRVAQVQNTSPDATGTMTAAVLPAGGYSLPASPFPLAVAPLTTATFTIRFQPTDLGAHDGTVTIATNTGASPLAIFVSGGQAGGGGGGGGAGGEVVTDYGVVSLAGGSTGTLTVDVPADAISLTLEGTPQGSSNVGLFEWTGPGGKVYENSSSTGAYVWSPSPDVFMATIPNTDRSDVQLVPGGGSYTFRLRRLDGSAGSVRVRAIVERRDSGSAGQGTLDLNVWLAKGISVKAVTAPTDTRLQAVLSTIDSILGQQGMSLGAIDYYDVTDPVYDRVTEAEFSSMLRLTSAAAQERLNLFFVVEAIGGGVVGVSPAIGGPKVNGTGSSGVMSVYEGFGTSLIGLIAAHEVGHYLGLYHTVEQTGGHDFIDDTVECPATGASAICPTQGGGYLLHWQAVGGSTLTNGQGLVERGHPCLAPTPGGSPKPRAFPPLLDADERMEAGLLAPGWCGTCVTCGKRTEQRR